MDVKNRPPYQTFTQCVIKKTWYFWLGMGYANPNPLVIHTISMCQRFLRSFCFYCISVAVQAMVDDQRVHDPTFNPRGYV